MARRVTHHVWLSVLVVAAGIGLGAGIVAGPPGTHHHTLLPDAVSVAAAAVEAAVVPARTEAGQTVATRESPGRSLLPLVVALVALTGLVALAAGQARPPLAGRLPLVARRHSIALRAPPSLQLA